MTKHPVGFSVHPRPEQRHSHPPEIQLHVPSLHSFFILVNFLVLLHLFCPCKRGFGNVFLVEYFPRGWC
jgi:hypothetical protein